MLLDQDSVPVEGLNSRTFVGRLISLNGNIKLQYKEYGSDTSPKRLNVKIFLFLDWLQDKSGELSLAHYLT